MSNKYLDKTGLSTVWSKVKSYSDTNLVAAKNDATTKVNNAVNTLNTSINNVQDQVNTVKSYFNSSGVANNATADSDGNVINSTYLKKNAVGVANGVCPLDSDVKIPNQYLPSYVDDVLEFEKISAFPSTGSSGIIYVDTTTNKTYRWTGTQYTEISASLALGTTSSTAYPGNKGASNRNDIDSIIDADPITTLSWTESDRSLGVQHFTGNGGTVVSDLALTSDIPTKTSELTNDSGYTTATAVANTYAKKSELDGYLPLDGGAMNQNSSIEMDYSCGIIHHGSIDSSGNYMGLGFTDEGEPCVVNKNGRYINISTGRFDGNGISYRFPEQTGIVALTRDLNNYVHLDADPVTSLVWTESTRTLGVDTLKGGGTVVSDLALTSDLPTAITTAEITEICV